MSCLSLYLLGPPRIERDGLPVRVDTRKAIALLAYIAITGEGHRRDALVNLLWPEYDQARGRTNLRRTLYALRKALAGDWLDVDREAVRLNPCAEVWLDVDQFHRHLAECLTHGHLASEVCPACLPLLTAAVALYRGDFLSGFSLKDSFNFDDWQFFQADALRREVANALARLVQGHIAQGAFEHALNYATQWLALDRLNEAAHYQLMQLYAWSGQRSAALRQYQECAKILENELGVSPQESTTVLHQAIQEGRAPKPPVALNLPRLAERELDRPAVQATIDVAKASTPPLGAREGEPVEARRGVFVARERELAQLGGYLDAALAGRGRVVFVIGGPGRGKTALIQEFARRAQDCSADLIFAGGKCNAYTGFGDPYLPFREILGLLTGDVDALWAAGAITREHARRLWDIFPLAVEALVEVGPDLIDTFIPGRALVGRAAAYAAGGTGGPVAWRTQLEELVEHKAAVPHDPNLHQSALFEQYARMMGALARERPLLLVLDDLQWADVASIDLLFHLGRGVAGGRVLIVGGYRPEEVAIGSPSTNSGERERHPLAPVVHEFQHTFGDISIDLTQADGRLFVEEYLDTEPNRLSAGFHETLYRQTRGHPLFTVELLHGMQERGELIQDGEGRWMEGPALDWETLPARVEAAIAGRIGRLDTPSREALRVASVEGETFTAEVVARVRSADERETVERLSGELDRRHRLVRAQEIQRLGVRRLSRYRFRHILFQNYLYHSLDPVERAHLHEAVGRALEELFEEETEQMAVTLAWHFQEAGIVDKAIAYLLQAGEKAKRSSANEAAIAHLTQALELLDTTLETPERTQRELDLQIALGVPLVLTKGHAAPEVEATYARARELSEQAGSALQLFQVLLGLRRYHLARGELQTAHELGEDLLTLAQSVQDSTHLSRAHMMHADTLDSLGEFAQCLEHSQQGIAAYDPQQCRTHTFLYGNDTGVGCQMYQALALWYLGYPDQALKRAEETLILAHELSHPFTLVFTLYYTARLHMLCGEVGAVQERVEALLRITTEWGFALFEAWGTILRGWVLAERGEIVEGIAEMQQGLAALRDMSLELLLPEFFSFLADAYGKAGQIEEGLRLVVEALTRVERTGELKFEAELHRLKGKLLLSQVEAKAEVEAEMGMRYHDAETCFQRALEVARRQSAKSWELRAAMSLSRLWQKQGKKEKARKLLQEIYGWFTEGFDTADLMEAKALLDALA
jgi:predicted ATPase/DNA-binding SARP family transcriptional activator